MTFVQISDESRSNLMKSGPNPNAYQIDLTEEPIPVRAVGPAGAPHESVVEVLQEDGDGAEDAVGRGQHEGVVYERPAARCQACIK